MVILLLINQQIIFSFNCLVYKMSELQFKTKDIQFTVILNTKPANLDIRQAEIREYVVFFLKKYLIDYQNS